MKYALLTAFLRKKDLKKKNNGFKNQSYASLAQDYIKKIQGFERQFEWLSVEDLEEKKNYTLCLLDISSNKKNNSFSGKYVNEGTEAMAQFVKDFQMNSGQGAKKLIWAIGDHDGWKESHYKQAQYIMTFGKNTFPHELATVMCLEQVYRSFSILNNHPYHLGH